MVDFGWRVRERQPAGRRLRQGRARGRTDMECQDIRDESSATMFRQGVVSFGEPAGIERLAQMGEPGRVKTVKGPGIHARPVVNGHDNSSDERPPALFYMRIFRWKIANRLRP